jgi:DNA-binding transcriptional LysR family regulator
MGLAVLPRYVARESLLTGQVQALLPGWVLPAQEIHAVFPSPRLVPTKVSGFVDWLQGEFGDEAWAR